MAFIRVEPVQVQVRTDWFSGRPREITWGDERLPVTRLAVVREEAAAYPGDQRAAHPVRGRHAAGPAVADVPAPLASLDGHRPRRRGPPRRLTVNEHRRLGLGPVAPAADDGTSLPSPVLVGETGRVRRYRARPGADPLDGPGCVAGSGSLTTLSASIASSPALP